MCRQGILWFLKTVIFHSFRNTTAVFVRHCLAIVLTDKYPKITAKPNSSTLNELHERINQHVLPAANRMQHRHVNTSSSSTSSSCMKDVYTMRWSRGQKPGSAIWLAITDLKSCGSNRSYLIILVFVPHSKTY